MALVILGREFTISPNITSAELREWVIYIRVLFEEPLPKEVNHSGLYIYALTRNLPAYLAV